MNRDTESFVVGGALGFVVGFLGAAVLVTAFPAEPVAAAIKEQKSRQVELARDIGSECTIEPAGRNCMEVCGLLGSDDLERECSTGISSGYIYKSIVGHKEE